MGHCRMVDVPLGGVIDILGKLSDHLERSVSPKVVRVSLDSEQLRRYSTATMPAIASYNF